MLTGNLLIECTQQVAVLFRLGVMTEDPQMPPDLDRRPGPPSANDRPRIQINAVFMCFFNCLIFMSHLQC
jgi:hypothetical protein